MKSVNKITLIGNVGSLSPLRHTKGGTAIINISLATNSRKDDNENERVDWHRIVAYGNVALLVQKFVKKGDRLYVEGRLQYGTYPKEVAPGVTVDWPTSDIWLKDIVFLERPPEGVDTTTGEIEDDLDLDD